MLIALVSAGNEDRARVYPSVISPQEELAVSWVVNSLGAFKLSYLLPMLPRALRSIWVKWSGIAIRIL